MLKKFNKFMRISIASCIMLAITGLFLIIYPNISMKVIAYIIAFILIISGMYLILDNDSNLFLLNFLPAGFLCFALGIVVLLYPEQIATLIPVLTGVWMIINATTNMQLSFILKKVGYNRWIISLILAIISTACGFLMIFNPKISALALTIVIGYLFIIYAVSFIAELIICKKHVNDIVKFLK